MFGVKYCNCINSFIGGLLFNNALVIFLIAFLKFRPIKHAVELLLQVLKILLKPTFVEIPQR